MTEQVSEDEIIRMNAAVRDTVMSAIGRKGFDGYTIIECVVRTLAAIINEQNRDDATWKPNEKM